MIMRVVHPGLIPAIRKRYAMLCANRIRSGVRTTFQFREFLRRTGWDVERGLLSANCPDPFPLTDPVFCHFCGEVFNESEMPARRLIREQISGPVERCHPAEYDDICPECGRTADLHPALRCAECDEHLCVCSAEDYQEPEA